MVVLVEVAGVALPPLHPAGELAAGGYLTEGVAGSPGFVAWGRGVRRGVIIPRMRQTDIAPPIALLLGLELGDVDGRALVGVLHIPRANPVSSGARRGNGRTWGGGR